jgi:hypothetical protein
LIHGGILSSGRRAVAIAIPLLAAWVPPCEAASSRLEAEIERQVERAVEGRLGFPGGLIVVQRESGELPEGGTHSFEIQLRRGEQLVAVGACDEHCSNLALDLTGPDLVRRFGDWDPGAFPVVGTRIARRGRYALHVSMRACTGRCRFSVAALVAPLGAATPERNRLDEARDLHSDALDPIRRGLEDRGCELGRIAGFQQPSLEHGRQESFPVEIPRAGKLLVAASCDYGCADLDLVLEDPWGEEIARDREIDPEPRLWVEVPAAGTYRVTVRMEHCRDGPCAYIASVLAPRPPAPGGPGDQGGCSGIDAQDLVAAAGPLDAGAAGHGTRNFTSPAPFLPCPPTQGRLTGGPNGFPREGMPGGLHRCDIPSSKRHAACAARSPGARTSC